MQTSSVISPNAVIEEYEGSDHTPPSHHLVVTIHGIQTYGKWQERLENLLTSKDSAITVVNYRYGYFSVLAFIVPFLRWIVTRRFRKALVHEISLQNWERIDIVSR